MLKNCKSQNCFEKNPIQNSGRFNRLKKIKKDLDKHQTLINEINNIKESLERKNQAKLKRSTSRTNRRNTLFTDNPRTNSQQAKLLTRSRSKTDFQSQNRPGTEKTGPKPQPSMYALNEKNHQKLSRNNSREPKDLKTKSFLKPTISSSSSTYKSHLKKDSYSTYINSKIVAGKKSAKSSNKQKYSYVGKKSEGRLTKPKDYPSISNVRHIQLNGESGQGTYKTNYAYKKNLSTMLKMKNQSRGSSNTRNGHMPSKSDKNYYGIARCGSVSYNSSVSSLRETMPSRRKSIRKGSKPKKDGSLDPPSYQNFLKSRRSLGDNKHTFHQSSHSTLPNFTQDLRDMKENKGKDYKGKFKFQSIA